jgi:hypothetical protein
MMGFNTVAVLYNDANFETEHDIGKRIRDAMRGWSWRERDRMATHFGAGMVVSQAHADYSQVVVVGQNRGRMIIECDDLDHYALGQIADALRRHGWTVKPPAKAKRKKADPNAHSKGAM